LNRREKSAATHLFHLLKSRALSSSQKFGKMIIVTIIYYFA